MVIKPEEVPVQAGLALIGLKLEWIRELYPPATKLPPAEIMSLKGPSPLEISRTPPFFPRLKV